MHLYCVWKAYTLALANTEIMKMDEMNFELLATPFHSQGILGADTCIRKPMIATCSHDRTIRLWNYIEKILELEKAFTEDAYRLVLVQFYRFHCDRCRS